MRLDKLLISKSHIENAVIIARVAYFKPLTENKNKFILISFVILDSQPSFLKMEPKSYKLTTTFSSEELQIMI